MDMYVYVETLVHKVEDSYVGYFTCIYHITKPEDILFVVSK